MPKVIDGTRLVGPRRPGDCSCMFCGLFRAHHYFVRAVIGSAVVPALLLAAIAIQHQLSHDRVRGVTVVAGALYLLVTGAAVIVICTWYQPLRRLVHRLRPRSR
jgi:hypothetical protein